MNIELRHKQMEFLDKCDGTERPGSVYVISDATTKQTLDTCQCAGTASMLLMTTYKDKDVLVLKGN